MRLFKNLLRCCCRQFLLREVPGFYLEACSAAIGALGCVRNGCGSGYDDGVPGGPVRSHAHAMRVDGLQSLEDADQLFNIAAELLRVVDDRTDSLLWID